MQNPPPYGAPVAAGGKSSTGLDANLAALLAYLFGWVGGLVFYLIEKESRFVRFHAMQSILLNVAVIAVVIAFMCVNTVLAFISGTLAVLFGLLWFVILIAIVGIAVLCMVKAFQGQEFKLPVIGDMAANIVNK
ncbi:MAG: DUF4870 domain-containing protein [Pyrinomonadaceae bacterium]